MRIVLTLVGMLVSFWFDSSVTFPVMLPLWASDLSDTASSIKSSVIFDLIWSV